MVQPMFGFDAYSPKEIAEKVQTNGVIKARLPIIPMAGLGIAGGGFIGLGALYYCLVIGDPSLGFAASRVLGGVVFCLGLMLVIVAGAELFTGNNFLVMAWADGKISTVEMARNWVVVYVFNGVGAIGLAVAVLLSHHLDMNNGNVGLGLVKTAIAKVSPGFVTLFFKGVLCNLLVCLGVWAATAGRSVTDKTVALIFPISAFVAAGFEHCIANMYFIPLAILYATSGAVSPEIDTSALTWGAFVHNLIPVTLGNIVGGSLMVALMYYIIYRKGLRSPTERGSPAERG